MAMLLALALQDPRPDLAARLSTRGKLLFSDDFSSGALGAEWKPLKGAWDIADGVLRGKEKAEDKHAAVLKYLRPYRNLAVQFSFKFDGAKQASLSMDGKGHVCRVVLTPKGFTLRKDGSADKSVKAVDLGKSEVELKAGEWHTMLVEVVGSEFLAQLDDKAVVFGANAGIDVDKASIGFPVSGEGFVIDDVRVWEATVNPEWPALREKLK